MFNKVVLTVQILIAATTLALIGLMCVGLWAASKHRQAADCYRAGGGEECASSNSRAVRVADRIMQLAS